MANPTGGNSEAKPDAQGEEPADSAEQPDGAANTPEISDTDDNTDTGPVPPLDDAQTVVMAPAKPGVPRYTAPGFDANKTEMIVPIGDDPKTEFIQPLATKARPKAATPETIAPRKGEKRSWGWVIALALVVAALAAVIVLAAVIISRTSAPKASQEELVRTSIQNYDNAIQTGNLAALRTITCGETRDGYVRYPDAEWSQTYQKVAAAKQYPVVASIDEVVVNGEHAEANVTSFMAFAPQTRSSRSFDLQLRDNQWKICQSD
ncbi:flagellar basal body-associated protein FliL [Mycobacteroides chelonae]|nr:flagellar basal body-associated protein FliL [Mycobacteroides chelonae]